jgi:hypothetical protein
VIPHSIATLAKKKPFADGFADGIYTPKKIFPLEIY